MRNVRSAHPGRLGFALAAGLVVTTPVAAQTPTVTVQNDLPVPLQMILEGGRVDERIGTVPPLTTTTLSLPAIEEGDEAQLVAHPARGTDLATSSFEVARGEKVEMLVEPHARLPEPRMTALLPPTELDRATLTVENEAAHPVTVYVETGPAELRLGNVAAHAEVTLPLPSGAIETAAPLAIVIHPQRGFDLEGRIEEIRPGEHLGLVIAPSRS